MLLQPGFDIFTLTSVIPPSGLTKYDISRVHKKSSFPLLFVLSGREDSNFRPWRRWRHTLANCDIFIFQVSFCSTSFQPDPKNQLLLLFQLKLQKKSSFPLLFFVGARRLELPTPCTPCKYASQLRHAPNYDAKISNFLIKQSAAKEKRFF